MHTVVSFPGQWQISNAVFMHTVVSYPGQWHVSNAVFMHTVVSKWLVSNDVVTLLSVIQANGRFLMLCSHYCQLSRPMASF